MTSDSPSPRNAGAASEQEARDASRRQAPGTTTEPRPRRTPRAPDPVDPILDLASRLRRGVLMTSRRLRGERTAELSEGQYSVLAHLNAQGASTPSDLAVRECVSAPSMTRMIAQLVDAGFGERAPHPTDGRQVLIEITPAGVAALLATRRRRDAWLASRLADLEPEELESLGRAADVLRRIATT